MKLPAIILFTIFGYVPGDPILDFENESEVVSSCTSASSPERSHIYSASHSTGKPNISCATKSTCDFQESFNNTKLNSSNTISLVDIIEFKYLNCAYNKVAGFNGPLAL